MTATDRNGLEVLPRPECLRLLRTAAVGRLAITTGALPVILPVNFLLHGDRILLRTVEGTKLAAATEHAVVCMEVDHFDGLGHTGWSVIVTGQARVVDDPAELHEVERLPIPTWNRSAAASRIVAISTDLVDGRRLSPPALVAGSAHSEG